MNIETGHVAAASAVAAMQRAERAKYVPVPRHLTDAARDAMVGERSLFEHPDQRVRQQARALADRGKRLSGKALRRMIKRARRERRERGS